MNANEVQVCAVDTVLNFDVYSRLTSIVGALANAGNVCSVLDVGGHPGLLAQSLQRGGHNMQVVTCDLPFAGTRPYVRGSGVALPFATASVDAVVISDVLEHIPADARAEFLSELQRVCKTMLVISGPWHTPGVAIAEECVCLMRDAAGAQPDRWLAEHRAYGLPKLQETLDMFTKQGWQCNITPENEIVAWFCMFAGGVMTELLPGADKVWREFMPQYNREFAHDNTGQNPAYRHLLTATRSTESTPCNVTYSDDVWEQTEARIAELCAMFLELIKCLRKAGVTSANVDSAYVAQLEAALAAKPKEHVCVCGCASLWHRIRSWFAGCK